VQSAIIVKTFLISTIGNGGEGWQRQLGDGRRSAEQQDGLF
jgi:hypothetical protein